MSAYEFFLTDVTFTNDDATAQINNAESVFGAIVGSQVFVGGVGIPETLVSVDNTARTITLSRPWPRATAENVEVKISPVASAAAQMSALTANSQAFTTFNNNTQTILNNPSTKAFDKFEFTGDFTEGAYLENQVVRSANGMYYYCLFPYSASAASGLPENDPLHWERLNAVVHGPTVTPGLNLAQLLSQETSLERLAAERAVKVNSLTKALAASEIRVGEIVETVSYFGDFVDQRKAYGGNTYLKISGQSYTQDLCRYIYTDDGNTLVALFPESIVTPEQAGAKPVTSFYSGDAISVANAVATALRYPLIFKGQDYDCGNKSFQINTYYTRWEGTNGTGTYLKWNAVPENGYAVQLFGENVYEQNDRMSKAVFKGINIVGASKNNEYDADAIQLGGNTSATKLSCCAIEKVNIRGFKITFRYHDYTWKIHITQCRTIGGCIETPPEAWNGAYDMGECMVIRDCFLADTSGKTSYFRRGEWKIIGTSFNNHPIEVLGGCIWTMMGSHIENPLNNSLTTKFLTVKGYAKAVLRDVWVTTNNRALIEPPLISEVPDTKTGGLFLDNFTWNMNNDYNPRGNGYDHQYIIGGSGRCGAKGMNYLGFQTYWAQPISAWTNMLGNGGFEQGDTSGWSIRIIDTSGGDNASCDLIAEATADVPRGGSYVGKFTANYGGSGGVQGGELYQGVRFKGGDLVTGGVYLKNDWDASDNAGLFQVIIYFFDASGNRLDFPDQYGNTISSYVPARYQTHVENWAYRQIGIIAPKGAARVEVCIQVLANTATPSSINAWVDNFHVEVQEYM